MGGDIQSVGNWKTNAELILDVRDLGWLDDNMSILDITYGYGSFWSLWRPFGLVTSDINPKKGDYTVDFTDIRYDDDSWDVIVYDPPYKLNGTPDPYVDEIYGVEQRTDWRDRMKVFTDGLHEVARCARKHVLVKCQDQVCSGEMRWQTDVATTVITDHGFRKADRFDFGRGREQPPGRAQKHARHGKSQLLVFTKGKVDNGVPNNGI